MRGSREARALRRSAAPPSSDGEPRTAAGPRAPAPCGDPPSTRTKHTSTCTKSACTEHPPSTCTKHTKWYFTSSLADAESAAKVSDPSATRHRQFPFVRAVGTKHTKWYFTSSLADAEPAASARTGKGGEWSVVGRGNIQRIGPSQAAVKSQIVSDPPSQGHTTASSSPIHRWAQEPGRELRGR